MDWDNAKDPLTKNCIVRKDSEWLEHTADWSMTLDALTWPLSQKTGLTNFDDTLDISLLNCITLLKTESRATTECT